MSGWLADPAVFEPRRREVRGFFARPSEGADPLAIDALW